MRFLFEKFILSLQILYLLLHGLYLTIKLLILLMNLLRLLILLMQFTIHSIFQILHLLLYPHYRLVILHFYLRRFHRIFLQSGRSLLKDTLETNPTLLHFIPFILEKTCYLFTSLPRPFIRFTTLVDLNCRFWKFRWNRGSNWSGWPSLHLKLLLQYLLNSFLQSWPLISPRRSQSKSVFHLLKFVTIKHYLF